MLAYPLEEQVSAARSSALPPVMMGMLSESLRRLFGDVVLPRASGGGDENLRLARGDLGGSPYNSLVFWLLAKNSSKELCSQKERERGGANITKYLLRIFTRAKHAENTYGSGGLFSCLN